MLFGGGVGVDYKINPKYKGRLLLFNLNSDDLNNLPERVDFGIGETKADIWYLSKYALKHGWGVKWYPKYQDYSLTFFAPEPIENENGEPNQKRLI